MALDLSIDGAMLVSDFGESLRFRINSEGTAREISANVNRNPLEEDSDGPYPGHRRAVIHVMVRNDSDAGVTPDEVVNDSSQIEIDYPLGASVRWMFINRILKQNAGCVLLEVQT